MGNASSIAEEEVAGGTARGGCSKDTRKSNFRGDHEEDGTGYQASSGNATGYFVRVGSDEKIAFAARARVRVTVPADEPSNRMEPTATMEKETIIIVFNDGGEAAGAQGQLARSGGGHGENTEHDEGARYGEGKDGG